jgi:hypothetical protein
MPLGSNIVNSKRTTMFAFVDCDDCNTAEVPLTIHSLLSLLSLDVAERDDKELIVDVECWHEVNT